MKLNSPLTIVLATILSLGVIAALWFSFAAPQAKNYKREAAERDSSLQKVEYYQQKIDEIKNSGYDYLGSLYEKVQIVDQLLPNDKSQSKASMAIAYDQMATAAGLDGDIIPGDTPPADTQVFFATFNGSYESILSWLQSLEDAPNLVTVSNIVLKENTGENLPPYNVTMNLTFHTTTAQPLRSSGNATTTGQPTAPSGPGATSPTAPASGTSTEPPASTQTQPAQP